MDLDDAMREVADGVRVDTESAWERHTEAARRWRRRRVVTSVAAAAAVVVVAVFGIVALTGDDEPDEVRTGPDVPSTFPAEAVVALEDGRLVVLDTATGDVLRTLATYKSIDAPPADPGAPGDLQSHLVDVTLAPRLGVVYVETCCEPELEAVWPRSLENGAALGGIEGLYVSISPDGTRIAAGGYFLQVRATGLQIQPDPPLGAYATSWVDDTTLAFMLERQNDVGRDGLWLIDVVGSSMVNPRLLVAIGKNLEPLHLATRSDGMLIWVDTVGMAHVVDPSTGTELSTFDLGSPVRDIAYDSSGTWLLTCTEDRRIVWHGGVETGTIPGRCVAAGW